MEDAGDLCGLLDIICKRFNLAWIEIGAGGIKWKQNEHGGGGTW